MLFLAYLLLVPVLCSSQNLEEVVYDIATAAKQLFVNENTSCIADLETFLLDLLRARPWSFRMLDASSKLNPGLLVGNTYHFGNYDECLNLVQRNEKHKVNITGKYCGIKILLKNRKLADYLNTQKYHFFDFYQNVASICLPETCSIEYINYLWYIIKNAIYLPFEIIIKDEFCLHKTDTHLNYKIDINVYIFLGILAGIIFICSSLDFLMDQFGYKSNELKIFSVYSNFTIFLSDYKQNQFSCTNGIRMITLSWIMLGQLAKTKAFYPSTNALYIFNEWLTTFSSTFILSSHYGIDNFLFLSGLFAVSNFVRSSETFNLTNFYINRLKRIIFPLFLVILLYVSVIKHLSHGPLWLFFLKENVSSCYNWWWSTLLFVNNYLPDSDRCIEQTWYLSINMQLYFAIPFVFLLIKKWPIRTIFTMAGLIVLCMCYTAGVTLFHKVGCASYIHKDYNTYILHSVVTHAPSFLIGGLFGFLLEQKRKISSSFLRMFLLFCVMLLLIRYNNIFFEQCSKNYIFAAVFNSVAKPLWAYCLGMITYECIVYGGYVNDFLSHSVFALLSKLNYCMFLCYLGVITAVAANRQNATTFSNFGLYFEFSGAFILAGICSTILYLCTEAPIVAYNQLSKTVSAGKKTA